MSSTSLWLLCRLSSGDEASAAWPEVFSPSNALNGSVRIGCFHRRNLKHGRDLFEWAAKKLHQEDPTALIELPPSVRFDGFGRVEADVPAAFYFPYFDLSAGDPLFVYSNLIRIRSLLPLAIQADILAFLHKSKRVTARDLPLRPLMQTGKVSLLLRRLRHAGRDRFTEEEIAPILELIPDNTPTDAELQAALDLLLSYGPHGALAQHLAPLPGKQLASYLREEYCLGRGDPTILATLFNANRLSLCSIAAEAGFDTSALSKELPALRKAVEEGRYQAAFLLYNLLDPAVIPKEALASELVEKLRAKAALILSRSPPAAPNSTTYHLLELFSAAQGELNRLI